MDKETGTKTAEEQPVVMPTTETGTKEASGMPPAIPLVDDLAVEKDGAKVVPFDSYKAEKEKRQEAEAKLKALETKPKEEPVQEQVFDWDNFLKGINPQPAPQPTQPTPQTQPTQPPNDVKTFMDSVNEQAASGDYFGANLRIEQFKRGYENNMKRVAREWIKDYDNLPLHTVSDEEVAAVQQNTEAIRGVLAKIKGGKVTQNKPAVQDNSGKPTETWDQIQERLKREGAEEYAKKLLGQSGVSGESARAGSATATEELVPDETAKRYFEQRKIPKEKWPQYLKQLQSMNGGY